MKVSVNRLLRVLRYVLLLGAVLVITLLLVLVGRGYRFDWRTGQITGGGLILLDSEPDNAQIWIDNKEFKKATPARLPLKADTYQVRLVKDGFRIWQKSLQVITSEVSFAQYIFLIANILEHHTIGQIDKPQVFSQSPNKKFVVAGSGGARPEVQLIETGQADVVARVIYSLPGELVKKGVQIQNLQWSSDSEHLLIQLSGNRYLVINVLNPPELVDLNKEFNTFELSGLVFSAKNWRELYWPSTAGLRRLDIGSKTISPVLAERLSNFIVSDDAVFLIQATGGSRRVLRLDRDNQTRVIVDNLDAGDYALAYTDYEQTSYLVLLDTKRGLVSLYDAASQSQQTLGRFDTVKASQILTSPNDRYLLMRDGAAFATFDFEFSKLHRFGLPAAPSSELSWFDNYHLLGNINGQATMFEFDGGNIETLVETEPLPSFSSQNRLWLYSIGKNESGQVSLRQSRLHP